MLACAKCIFVQYCYRRQDIGLVLAIVWYFFAFISCPNRKAGSAEFTNASFHCTIILHMTVVAAWIRDSKNLCRMLRTGLDPAWRSCWVERSGERSCSLHTWLGFVHSGQLCIYWNCPQLFSDCARCMCSLKVVDRCVYESAFRANCCCAVLLDYLL